ncbi:MAG TPA: zinc ABC transporter substrate-binding protein [Pseudogracilibacillus sp.]|nr:zinc ABC transporter substrate-binding protein [Pseudogracilibacillus sp.]
MRKLFQLFMLISLSMLVFVACSANDNGNNASKNIKDTLRVVTTFTLLEDIVREIGGENVEVYNLVPIGTDPHEYDPLPNDIKAATDADVIFYNGLNLEGGESGWLAKMLTAVNKEWDDTYKLTEGVEPLYLTDDEGRNEEINPHAFLDPHVGIQMVENARDAFIEIDPENEEYYIENAEQYITELEDVALQYEEKVNDIQEENRILITSERAYQYVADRYGLQEGYIWAIDTEEAGSPEQLKSLVEFIERENPPVLFVETNVDKRPMETVAEETGVEIYGEIYSDEIGSPGEEGDTYLKFLQYNIDVIHAGLTSK